MCPTFSAKPSVLVVVAKMRMDVQTGTSILRSNGKQYLGFSLRAEHPRSSMTQWTSGAARLDSERGGPTAVASASLRLSSGFPLPMHAWCLRIRSIFLAGTPMERISLNRTGDRTLLSRDLCSTLVHFENLRDNCGHLEEAVLKAQDSAGHTHRLIGCAPLFHPRLRPRNRIAPHCAHLIPRGRR